MKYKPEQIASGSLNNKIVWICDYRYNDIRNKPIRFVEPTECIVLDKKDCKEKVCYSQSFLVKLKKDGMPSSKQIQLFDNTGYRSISGTALNVFDNEKECRQFFVKQCEDVKLDIIAYQKEETDTINDRLLKIEKLQDKNNK